MTADLSVLMVAICLGAVLQVDVGIGFSIIAGPPMMILMGTSTAVPVLLLNSIVSVVATDQRVIRAERATIRVAVAGCLTGIVAGLVVYPILSEAFVLALTGGLLLVGLTTTLLPLKREMGKVGFTAVSVLSGLATVWAATPGSLTVFGLIAKGYPARAVANLVQPIAVLAYGIAFILHSLTGYTALSSGPHLWGFVGVTIVGSILGRALGPYLPQPLISGAIRLVSAVACCVLFHRAYTLV